MIDSAVEDRMKRKEFDRNSTTQNQELAEVKSEKLFESQSKVKESEIKSKKRKRGAGETFEDMARAASSKHKNIDFGYFEQKLIVQELIKRSSSTNMRTLGWPNR